MISRFITDIDGVFASGIASGIKKNLALDLAFIYVPNCFASAGVFTQNQWAAPSVHYSKSCISKGQIKAIIVNSGNANAATGNEGAEDVVQTAKKAANLLGLKPHEVAIASTGVIGKRLPMDKLFAGLETLLKDPHQQNGQIAAESILTTDKFPKTVFSETLIGKETIKIAGMTKGCGMIAPNMATTLSFMVTDARIEQSLLQSIVKETADETFNMTSVDTDSSTNDMLIVLSTGTKDISITDVQELTEFKKAFTKAAQDLAVQLVKDGEGATKVIEVKVLGAESLSDARSIAKNIANSPLVKTAVFGADPNWGRVLMAAGKDPKYKLDTKRFDLYFGNTKIIENGNPLAMERESVRHEMQKDYVEITVNLNLGTSSAKAWGCDLTHEYIDINTQYS